MKITQEELKQSRDYIFSLLDEVRGKRPYPFEAEKALTTAMECLTREMVHLTKVEADQGRIIG